MILGYRLKLLRKQNNMSQSDLGNLLGVTKVSISGYENGTRTPSMDKLIALLNIFKISADYILGREENVICENDSNLSVFMAKADIDIINELKTKPSLYNAIVSDPKRFFATIYKKNI